MTASVYKNNVTRLLESRRVAYILHRYEYDAGIHSAVEVAAAIGLPPERVYKTLVALTDDPRRKPLLVIVPGDESIDLKTLARAVQCKKARMASHDEAESLTGLQTGGISALSLLNKGFDIYLDLRAQAHATIAVSAGERGANVEVGVTDLAALLRARWIDLA